MISQLAFVSWTALLIGIHASSASLRIGADPPPLRLQGAIPAALSDPEGRVTMIEFWTTWCAGCVAAIPHMNDLVDALDRESFSLIIVSNEEPAHVRSFLEDRPVRAEIVFDRGYETTDAWRIGCYPPAVLLDLNGKIAAVTDPSSVTPEVVRRLLRGEAVSLLRLDPGTKEEMMGGGAGTLHAESGTPEGATADDAGDLFHLRIRPNPDRERPTMFPPDHGLLSADDYNLRLLVAAAWDVSQWYQLDYRLPESSTVYSLELEAPRTPLAARRAALQRALETTFGLTTRWEDREREVFVLRRLEGARVTHLAASLATESTGRATPLGIELHGASIRKLARLLSAMVLDAFVIDETGMAGRYDLKASWPARDAASVAAALHPCGLELTQETHRVPVLVVEPAIDGLRSYRSLGRDGAPW